MGSCGADVTEAIEAFVARLMGTTERQQLRQMSSEFSAVELSKVGGRCKHKNRRWMFQTIRTKQPSDLGPCVGVIRGVEAN